MQKSQKNLCGNVFSIKELEEINEREIFLAKLNELPSEEKEKYLLNVKAELNRLDLDFEM